MSYAQIVLIGLDDLPEGQRDWIEKAMIADCAHHIVSIEEGDASRPMLLDTEDAFSPYEIAKGIESGELRGRTITISTDDKETCTLLKSLLKESDREERGYWANTTNFWFEPYVPKPFIHEETPEEVQEWMKEKFGL